MTATSTIVSSASIFAGCSEADIGRVVQAISGVRRVAEDEVVCRQHDAADRCWIVVEGLADVTVDGLYVGSVGPGETIGELALLDGEPRAATVTAVSAMQLLEMRADGFLDALEASASLSLAVLREVSRWLRHANRRPAAPTRGADRVVLVPPPRPASRPTAFDPATPGYTESPYDHLAAVRESSPVAWSEAISSYVVTRHSDVHRLARTRALIGSAMTTEPPSSRPTPGYRMMIRRDGEDHLRLRRLMSRVFTPRAVSQWRHRAESIVERLLDSAAERGEIDVIADYALPLPAQVISEMLGLPPADIPQLRAWSRSMTTAMETFSTQDQLDAAADAGRAMTSYLDEAMLDKRKRPADDLLSALLVAEDAGHILGDKEVRAQVMMLYVAGHETTLNLIGNGLTHLFRFPDQLERLRANRDLDLNAVEEMLRFDSPVQLTRRVATEPVEIDGRVLEAGSHITLCLGAANRDPRKWGPTHDVLDVGRPGANEHVSFGGGGHYCLGASLARIEAAVAIPGLIRRFPAMAPAYDEPRWTKRVALRGLEAMPVTVR
jgi:cytochrome P450